MSIKYEKLTVAELKAKAKAKGCVGYSKLKKEEIIIWLRSKCPKKSPKSKIKSASPNLRSASPNLRSASPNLRSASPNLRSVSPRLRSRSPSWNTRVPQPRKGARLEELTVEQLRQKAKMKNCIGYRKMKKADLINEIRNGCSKTKTVIKPLGKPGKVNLQNVHVTELRAKVKRKGCKGYSSMKKEKLITELREGCTEKRKVPANEYENLSVSELRAKVHKQGCSGYSKMNKATLINELKKGCSS